jgi:hypothetical protein
MLNNPFSDQLSAKRKYRQIDELAKFARKIHMPPIYSVRFA